MPMIGIGHVLQAYMYHGKGGGVVKAMESSGKVWKPKFLKAFCEILFKDRNGSSGKHSHSPSTNFAEGALWKILLPPRWAPQGQ